MLFKAVKNNKKRLGCLLRSSIFNIVTRHIVQTQQSFLGFGMVSLGKVPFDLDIDELKFDPIGFLST